MQIEVISRYPAGNTQYPPLLFIHGAYCDGRIWEPYFLPFFAERGFEAHALSLRGHGTSEGRDQLHNTRLRHYVDDVAQVSRMLERPPIVIGTSMGGLVAQHYIQQYPAEALVLLASGPPHGMWPSVVSMSLTNPWLAYDLGMMQLFGPAYSSMHTVKRALFLPDTDDEYVRQFVSYAQPESALVMLDMIGWDLPDKQHDPQLPVLVLGAGKDAFVTQSCIKQTAKHYNVEAHIFSEMAHGMMLDPNWKDVAQHIGSWLMFNFAKHAHHPTANSARH